MDGNYARYGDPGQSFNAASRSLRTFSVGFAGIGTLYIVDEGEVVLRIDDDPQASYLLAASRLRSSFAATVARALNSRSGQPRRRSR